MATVLALTILNELKKKVRNVALLDAKDEKIEIFLIQCINEMFPEKNEMKQIKSKDIINKKLDQFYKELDRIVDTKKRAVK